MLARSNGVLFPLRTDTLQLVIDRPNRAAAIKVIPISPTAQTLNPDAYGVDINGTSDILVHLQESAILHENLLYVNDVITHL